MYGMSEYLMIMHEVEKARLADRVRKSRQKEEPFPTGSSPSATGKKCTGQRTLRG